MDEYIEHVEAILKKLYRIQGINIMEIGNMAGVIGKWALYQAREGIMEIMFFSSAQYFHEIDFEKIYSKAYELGGNNNIRLIAVIAEPDNKDVPISYPHCGLILVDNSFSKILHYESSTADMAFKLSECINICNEERSRSKSLPFEKIKDSEITYALIIANIIVYVVTAILSRDPFTSNINVLVYMGAKVDYLIREGEYYRLLTCMFLHGGIMHIALNMYALFAIGPLVEKLYGKLKYIIIYFLSGITASLFSYVFSPSISIGASGAIFGLFGAMLLFALKMKGKINRNFTRSIASVIVVNLILGFSVANVDNFGHIGGLVGGMASAVILKRQWDS